MTHTASIYEALGGPSVLHASTFTIDELREQIRQGLPFSALEALMVKFDLGREEVSEALHLPSRTLTRRKAERLLRPDESDRLVRLASIAARATEVLGNEEKASRWLQVANRSLGGQVPLELLDTSIGTRQVEEVLGRIEHGVYS